MKLANHDLALEMASLSETSEVLASEKQVRYQVMHKRFFSRLLKPDRLSLLAVLRVLVLLPPSLLSLILLLLSLLLNLLLLKALQRFRHYPRESLATICLDCSSVVTHTTPCTSSAAGAGEPTIQKGRRGRKV